MSEYYTARRARLTKAGRCWDCGKYAHGRSRCPDCAYKQQQSRREAQKRIDLHGSARIDRMMALVDKIVGQV